MGYTQIGKVSEFAPGKMRVVIVQNQEVLVIRGNDQFYAVSNRCPHLGGKLSSGQLDGTIITCPLHGSQFDVTDGHVVRWTNFSGFIVKIGRALKSPRSLKVYEVQVKDNDVFITL